MARYFFPFGNEVGRVAQTDTTEKKVFVLGVYASAVHARWIGEDGKQKVAALAVASEPKIFWRGEDADQLIKAISMPPGCGKLLLPRNRNMNGPSGKTLDDKYLSPLGLTRAEVWLCDLMPESRVNEKQRSAIEQHYKPLVEQKLAPAATIPDFKEGDLDSAQRRLEILNALKNSNANTILTLGDLPIKWFISFYKPEFQKLNDFLKTGKAYGERVQVVIDDKEYDIIPLCHPRQAGNLGTSSAKWSKYHREWQQNLAK